MHMACEYCTRMMYLESYNTPCKTANPSKWQYAYDTDVRFSTRTINEKVHRYVCQSGKFHHPCLA